MKITLARWTAGCVIACAVIFVLSLPAEPEGRRFDDYRWWSSGHAKESRISQRASSVGIHLRGLEAAYASATDAELARRAFGSVRADSGAPMFSFAADVPEHSRRTVAALIARERSARGEWAGRGSVGVLVETDTATAIDHVKLPERFDRDRAITTEVLPASVANRNPCVTVIRLRHRALTLDPEFAKDRTPLDGCAFTDAFGQPGPQIAEWLRKERYVYARRLVFELPADERGITRNAWDEGDVAGRSCRAGDDRACLAVTSAFENLMWWDPYYGYRRQDYSVPPPAETGESLYRINWESDLLLESLARDLGPVRFQRVWQSQKSLADAYFDQTGETLAAWVRGRLVRYYGPYRIGALPAASENMLTLILLLVLAGISIRFAPRPSVA